MAKINELVHKKRASKNEAFYTRDTHTHTDTEKVEFIYLFINTLTPDSGNPPTADLQILGGLYISLLNTADFISNNFMQLCLAQITILHFTLYCTIKRTMLS